MGHALAFDTLADRIILYGGDDGSIQRDTWIFQLRSSWPEESCGTTVDEDGDGLTDCADPDCDGICRTCGNMTCDPHEDCFICPGDCAPCPPVCGDFTCQASETCGNCPGDCC